MITERLPLTPETFRLSTEWRCCDCRTEFDDVQAAATVGGCPACESTNIAPLPPQLLVLELGAAYQPHGFRQLQEVLEAAIHLSGRRAPSVPHPQEDR